jgi:hypothetical protein
LKYHQPFDQPASPDASYINANPSLGIKGSILDGIAVEQVQREILKVVTEAGLTPADGDLTQLWQAIQSLAGTITNTAITNYLIGGSVAVNIPYAVAGGTADVITAAFSPVLGSLVDGQVAIVKIGASSNATTTPTLNANGLGAKVISRNDGSALAAADLVAQGFAVFVYDTATTSWKFVAGIALSGGGGTGGGSLVPGCIYTWPTETPPTGALECNGAAVSRSTYSRLYGILGTLYGPGNGSTTFNLPDLRGEIVRGWDHARSIDPDRTIRTDRGDGTTGDHVGTKQNGAAGPISLSGAAFSGTFTPPIRDGSIGGLARLTIGDSGTEGSTTTITGTVNVSGNSGAAETRMRNVNMMHIIAY